jgi:tyrosyl-tRNA synthetase
MLHGQAAAEAAANTARRTFEEGSAGGDLPTLANANGMSVIQALTGIGFAASNGEARRKIAEGAVKLDGEAVSDPQLVLSIGETPIKLSLGKKRHGLLTA